MRDCKPIDTVERTTILAGLLAGDERPPNPFGDADLAALWVHQMGASVATALREGSSDALAKPTELQKALDRHGITSFFDLFEHPAPPAVIMAEVRRYARQLMTLGADEFPPEVARALSALADLCSATGKSGGASRQGTVGTNLGRWCLAQSWLDDRTREMVRQRLARLLKAEHG